MSPESSRQSRTSPLLLDTLLSRYPSSRTSSHSSWRLGSEVYSWFLTSDLNRRTTRDHHLIYVVEAFSPKFFHPPLRHLCHLCLLLSKSSKRHLISPYLFIRRRPSPEVLFCQNKQNYNIIFYKDTITFFFVFTFSFSPVTSSFQERPCLVSLIWGNGSPPAQSSSLRSGKIPLRREPTITCPFRTTRRRIPHLNFLNKMKRLGVKEGKFITIITNGDKKIHKNY